MNFFLNRYKKYGYELDPDVKIKDSLRINTLKDPDIIRRLRDKEVYLEKIPFLQHGYYYEADYSLGSTPEFLMGYYHLQEAASQAVAEVLDPGEELVLDMCAAPGSKTTHLCQRMANKGVVVAIDSNLNRIDSLKNNLERLGCSNCIVYKKDALYASDLGKEFDKVLLDAPCSGNFVTDDGWFEKRDIHGIKENAEVQKDLITSAVDVLKPGGILVYSTCSLEPEENEEVIEYALDNLDVDLLPVDIDTDKGLTERTKNCRRFWPPKAQGFFIAKLKKRS